MDNSEKIKAIIDKILAGKCTDSDVENLRQLLITNSGETIITSGKNVVGKIEGQDIQIGDRNYYTWNDEAIQALIKALRTSQENDFNTDYFRTIEACENS
ncbi:MAG: hypothetical protein WA865_14550, partial [Spirulinaceae cyanobacterium]